MRYDTTVRNDLFDTTPGGRGRRMRGGFGPSGRGPGGEGFGPGGRGRGGKGARGGRWRDRDVPQVDVSELQGWFAGRLPDAWFTETATVRVDRDEITVVGTLPDDGTTVEGDEKASDAARRGRISRFREDTREQRMGIADEAEQRYGRKVAWGARLGETEEIFTSLAVPVMTRLRQPEREVLDTLVDAGVARSRADALAWCVALVGQHTDDWLGQLRDALRTVDTLRDEGPAVS